jgi:hypothetical protein
MWRDAWRGLWRRGADHDRPFIGFVVLSLLLTSYSVVQRVRLRFATSAFQVCSARADPECARRELRTMVRIDDSCVRTGLAKAQLRALLGEADQAERELLDALATRQGPGAPWVRRPDSAGVLEVDSEAADSLERPAHADLLLLTGDLAWLRGDLARARASWARAAPLVDDQALVTPRRERLAEWEKQAAGARAAFADSLRALFERLFENASAGRCSEAQAVASEIEAMTARVGSQYAVQSLWNAIQRGMTACALVASRRSASMHRAWDDRAWRPSLPPVPPSDEQVLKYPWLARDHKRKVAEYRARVEAWDSARSKTDFEADVSESRRSGLAADAISNARASLEKGVGALGSVSPPAPGAPSR